MSLPDLIESESDYAHLLSVVLKSIKKNHKISKPDLTKLISDSEIIFKKIHSVDSSVFSELVYVLSNLSDAFDVEVSSYVSNSDKSKVSTIVSDLNKFIRTLKNDSSLNGITLSSTHLKDSLLKKVIKDHKILSSVKDIDFEKLSLVNFLDDYDHLRCNRSKLFLVLHSLLKLSNTELSNLSKVDRHTLYCFSLISSYLNSSIFDFDNDLISLRKRANTLRKSMSIELSENIKNERKLSEISWHLTRYEPKFNDHKKTIGYHSTNFIYVQYALLHNSMFGPLDDTISVSTSVSHVHPIENLL